MKWEYSILICYIMVNLCGCCKNQNISENIDKDKVIINSVGVCESSMQYENIEQLSKDASDIIYGEIEEIDYFVENGIIGSIEDVRVLETFQGSLEKDQVIKVFHFGGYATITEYLNSFPEEDRKNIQAMDMIKNIDKSEFDSKYIRQCQRGDNETAIGDKSVYFLEYEEVMHDIYNRVGGWQGEYTELSNGYFKIPSIDDELENTFEQDESIALEELKESIAE